MASKYRIVMSMVIRYRPGEALRWLGVGADGIRRDATERGRRLAEGKDRGAWHENARTAVGALVDLGKSAYADVLTRRLDASEYVLQEDRLDIVRGPQIESVPYRRIGRIEVKGDRITLMLDRGQVVIKPFAHIVAGRAKVPIGWMRNGIEVPYEQLVEELAARAGLDPIRG
jgi:hypothetical protein